MPGGTARGRPSTGATGHPSAVGEEFTLNQHGYEDVSHERRPLYLEKRRVVPYRIACTYGWTAVGRSTLCPIDRDKTLASL